jgi:uncharacterized membrane protein
MMHDMAPHRPELRSPVQSPRLSRLLLGGGLTIAILLFLLTPGSLLDKADHVGYAVCHQIPVRSYFFGGRQLPLCARCSGQYLGALCGLALLLILGRRRAALLPPRAILGVLLSFFAIWAFDGLNSYLTLFPGLPHLYEPSNLLRVTTGGLQGVALIALALPFFNITLWAEPEARPTVGRWRELALLVALVVAIAALVSSQLPILLYPLALASAGGTLMMLVIVNSMLLAIILRREALARSWRGALPLLAAALGLAAIELLIVNLLRAWLTATLGLPF